MDLQKGERSEEISHLKQFVDKLSDMGMLIML